MRIAQSVESNQLITTTPFPRTKSRPSFTTVTGGVAEALVATASGLFIAMTGLVFLNNLNNRIRLMVHQLETLKQILINRYAQPCNQTGNRADSPTIALARTGS